jgi:superfamily II DNA or RNA helicase
MSDNGYAQFLAGKLAAAPASGFDVDASQILSALFDWQKAVVRWALRQGRAALFLDCGMGKTPMQLAWAAAVCGLAGGSILILCPLAVAAQTQREGEKFGVPVTVCKTQADVRPGVNVANYERLEKFVPAAFGGVVLDESSILKSYTGKTKRALIAAFANTPYRLCCTATPSPNDTMELGNHADFLGIMPSTEMLTRWFINDAANAGVYRLKGHAEADFWRWVASWAVCAGRPSDLGYPDGGFALPPLDVVHHAVSVDAVAGAEEGMLIRSAKLTATTLHREMRLTADARAAHVAALVATDPDDYWVAWCQTDYEADALRRVLPAGTVEVRGSEPAFRKEAKLETFSRGESRIMVSKPKLAGFGLNWQHCRNVAYLASGFSWEQYYQAVRRVWRFGQKRDVRCHVVAAATEGDVVKALRQKGAENDRMRRQMVEAVRVYGIGGAGAARSLVTAGGDRPMVLPAWIKQPADANNGSAA